MPTDVIMPQMGESIFEGTITKWLKKPGDTVQRDEPLFEISTDKVDAEIPSPASGVLTEVKIRRRQHGPDQHRVGVIGDGDGQAPAAAAAQLPSAAGARRCPPSAKHSPAPVRQPAAAPALYRRDHAPDGRVDFRRHHHQVAEEAGRYGATGRAAL